MQTGSILSIFSQFILPSHCYCLLNFQVIALCKSGLYNEWDCSLSLTKHTVPFASTMQFLHSLFYIFRSEREIEKNQIQNIHRVHRFYPVARHLYSFPFVRQFAVQLLAYACIYGCFKFNAALHI